MRVLNMIDISEILYKWSKGEKIKAIARSTGISRNTIRAAIKKAEKYGVTVNTMAEDVEEVASKIKEATYKTKSGFSEEMRKRLEKFDEQIKGWLEEDNITITQICRLMKEVGEEFAESTVRRYVRDKYDRKKNVTIRIVTEAGEEGQVDYGYCGMMKDEKDQLKKVYIFVMTLSYSRYRYVEFTFKQNVRSWVQCHINAFEFFGGVPKRIILDNLKSGVIKTDIYDPIMNRNYYELERFYGFVADPAKVATPKHKGKVERSIRIVKEQLIAGVEYKNIEEANKKARDWCINKIAHKITRTTGKTPKELFEREEKKALMKLPVKVFDIADWTEVKIHNDHHFVYKGNFYSVATKYLNQQVKLRAGMRTIEVYYKESIIKIHTRKYGKGKWSTDIKDYAKSALKYLENTPEKCIKDSEEIGKSIAKIIKKTLERRSNVNLRKSQAILRLGKSYSNERLEKACKRALLYDNCSYKGIKNILKKGLDSETKLNKSIEKEVPIKDSFVRPSSEYATNTERHYE